MFPQAENLARYWANIRNCVDAITEVPESHWKLADYYDRDPQARDRTYAHRGGFLAPVDFPLLDFGISPHSIDATDTTQLLGLLVARAALDDAGYPFDGELDRDRVSVILGVTGTLELVIPLGARLGHPIWRDALKAAGVDEQTSEDVVERIAASYVDWQENSFPGLLGNVAAGRIANRLDLRGTNCVVDAACASSLAALNLAMLELAANRCDLAVTGGLDAFNDIFMFMCFSKTPALSPSGDARPFDAQADGTVLGEGLGVLVLKRLEDARRDKDRIYAVIRSLGTSSDGIGQAVYAPSPAGQASALNAAYQSAGISPAAVELVEAHGTGTRVGDAAELGALEEVYRGTRPSGPWCALGSVKSQVGHTKAAAGAAGMIKAALALHHKVLPPTTKVSRPIDPLVRGDSPFYLNALPRPWLPRPGQSRCAAVSAFGFGGSNFHCVLEEADSEKPGIDWDGDVQIIAFSADNPGELTGALRAWDGCRNWDEVREAAATSRSQFDSERRYRVLLVARREGVSTDALVSEALADLEAGLDGIPHQPSGRIGGRGTSSSGRVFTGLGPRAGLLAMLFPGQGSQYAGMLRELACQFPQLQKALALVNGAFGRPDAPLADLIYPPSAFDQTTLGNQEAALRDTRIAQAAIGAVSLGSLWVLEEFGLRPVMAGGHSFGELTALCAGGRIDAREFADLACRRGELMADCARRGDSGAMLAVFTTLDDLLRLLREEALDLVVANRNAPRQHVLAGARGEIERAREICASRKITTAPIAVSAAFHSQFVVSARAAFRKALESIEPRRATIPVFANTSGVPYPDDAVELRELLAGQIAKPVEFVAQIEEMYRMGARTFVEVGPDAKLTGLVSSILEGRAHTAVAMDGSRGAAGNIYDLACVLASLAALGYTVDLARWDSGPKARGFARKQRGLTAKISGANAKPKGGMTDDRIENRLPTPPEPTAPLPAPAAAGSPRFSMPTSFEALPPADHEPRKNGAVDSIADFSSRTIAQRGRTQVPAHHAGSANTDGPRSGGDAEPRAAVPLAAPDVLRAFQTAQENLLSLQRLATQTAEVHRLFLEGQDRIQQTFSKLLEQGERVGREIHRREDPDDPAARHSSPEVKHSANSLEIAPSLAFAASSDFPDRNGAIERCAAPARVAPANPEHSEAQPAALPGSDAVSVATIVIEVVSDKTGYPPEVLGLDMSLDADLGIDSIKRVEILSALHERLPTLPALPPEQVGALRTLRAIVELISPPGNDIEGQCGTPVAADADGARIAQVLLENVADKTGYPLDMLELDMKLDADLGIDSIKRVEILSAIQDRLPGVRALKPEQLGQLRTLCEIAAALADPSAEHLSASDPGRAAKGKMSASDRGGCEQVSGTNAQSDGQFIRDRLAGVQLIPDNVAVTILRQHPSAVPLVAPDVRSEIRLPAGGNIWITDDGSELTGALKRCLEEQGYRASVVLAGAGFATAGNETLCGLVIVAPRQPGADFTSQAFRTLRAAGPALERSARAGAASLLTVSRMDGRFGVMGLEDPIDPASGALAGLAKTAGHEWVGVHCKAVDLDSAIDDPNHAARLIVEEFLKHGPVEIGLTARESVGLELVPVSASAPGAHRRRPPAKGDLFVISGGARGITAAVAAALARAFQPRLALIGKSPEPRLEDPGLSSLTTEAKLKRGLLDRSGRRIAPAELGEQVRQILAAREIRETLARIEAAGSAVSYHSLDVRDPAAVRQAMVRIRQEHGPIRGLIHGAGALADRRIIDQTDAQFNLVYDTKVKGLQNLLEGVDLERLEWLILFSSSTARFGRTGQAAYAAANEALNKWAQRLSSELPECRVVSYNWGPWDGGMVTADLKPVFEREGIALIPQADGAQLVAREIQCSDSHPAEIVVFAQPPSVEGWVAGETDGALVGQAFQPDVRLESLTYDTRNSAASPSRAARRATLAGDRAQGKKLETAFRREVSLAALPVLASHVIDGYAVLPMALIIEWLAEGASQRNPGLVVAGIDDMRLYKGVILNGPPSVAIEIRAGRPARVNGEFRVAVEMCGTLAGGREAPLARADVVLTARHGSGSPRLFHRTAGVYPDSNNDLYDSLLFHGPAMQGIVRVDGCNQHGISGWTRTRPSPAEWIKRPTRSEWLFDPLAIDCAFQLVVLWCRQQIGACSLPTGLRGYRQFKSLFPANEVRVVAEIREAFESRAVADIEFLDGDDDLIARIEGYECVIDLSLNQAFRRNELATAFEARTGAAAALNLSQASTSIGDRLRP
jgi:acyl transferase domain-containing protein/NAD(P)-dependent dehydrogenase (short-subunit alcohol dehydrogenase family)